MDQNKCGGNKSGGFNQINYKSAVPVRDLYMRTRYSSLRLPAYGMSVYVHG